MPIINQLVELYKRRHHHIVTGIHSRLSGLPLSEFTHIVTSDGKSTPQLGISPQEVYFLEHLFDGYHPSTIFIVGNSFGWSTFAFALLNPAAKIVAIDAGWDEFTSHWIEQTNRIASEEQLNVVVDKGVSPQEVPAVVQRNFTEPVEFVFIDGNHSDEQVVLDFEAIQPFCGRETIYLFHDVLFWNLRRGIETIRTRSGLDCHVLWRTSTGMCLLCDNRQHQDKLTLLQNFSLGPKTTALFEFLRKQQEQGRSQQVPDEETGGDTR